MNKEFMLETADFLDKLPPEQFDMNSFFCETAACIAGHMCLRNGWVHYPDTWSYVAKGDGLPEKVACVAARLGGLTDRQADELFYNPDIDTPTEAAAAIRKMVEEPA